MIGIGRRAR